MQITKHWADFGPDKVQLCQSFIEEIEAIAARCGKAPAEVYALWRKYSDECRGADQSAILSEFQEWYKADLATPDRPPATVVVRRNLARNGVEIQFPDKPSAEKLSELKAAGFHWSHHAKVWYKKFGSYAWAQAHTIAGLPLALSGASAEDAGAQVDRFDLEVEDRMKEACGL